MISGFPELLVSLSIQCTLLLLVARTLQARNGLRDSADQIWSWCHLLILLLTFVGAFLPHVRLLRSELLLDVCHRATTSPILQQFWTAIFWLWLLVAAALTVNLLRSLIQVSLMLRNATKLSITCDSAHHIDNNNWLWVSTSLARDLEARDVHVLTSENCSAPFCWQLHRPLIVLPEFIEAFPADEMQAIVRHELAHLQARHPMQLFLQRLVEIGFWFHPLVWKTSRNALMQRELVADRLSNATQEQAVAFVRSLVRLTDTSLSHVATSSLELAAVTGGPSLLRTRVNHLLTIDWNQNTLRSAVSWNRTLARSAVYLFLAATVSTFVWIPLNPLVTGRTIFSPWPAPTATLLHEAGIDVRDYELDSHRITESLREAK